MDYAEKAIWEQENTAALAGVFATISDISSMQDFLRDVMTEKEIVEISARLQAAIMLSQGRKYGEIIATTKLSSRTVARISDWLQNGTGGYRKVIESIHQTHLPPACAE